MSEVPSYPVEHVEVPEEVKVAEPPKTLPPPAPLRSDWDDSTISVIVGEEEEGDGGGEGGGGGGEAGGEALRVLGELEEEEEEEEGEDLIAQVARIAIESERVRLNKRGELQVLRESSTKWVLVRLHLEDEFLPLLLRLGMSEAQVRKEEMVLGVRRAMEHSLDPNPLPSATVKEAGGRVEREDASEEEVLAVVVGVGGGVWGGEEVKWSGGHGDEQGWVEVGGRERGLRAMLRSVGEKAGVYEWGLKIRGVAKILAVYAGMTIRPLAVRFKEEWEGGHARLGRFVQLIKDVGSKFGLSLCFRCIPAPSAPFSPSLPKQVESALLKTYDYLLNTMENSSKKHSLHLHASRPGDHERISIYIRPQTLRTPTTPTHLLLPPPPGEAGPATLLNYSAATPEQREVAIPATIG